MPHHSHVSLSALKEFLITRRCSLKKAAFALGAICALIMAAAFCFADMMFAEPFKQNPWLPGAFEAWCLAQCFCKVADFFKEEAEENISLIRLPA